MIYTFSLAIVTLCNVISANASERPVIGVLAQELDYEAATNHYPATSYIPTMYVLAVEASGARVVPIFIRKNESYYEKILHSINGVVFPGGHARRLPGYGFYDAVAIIYRIAKKMNDEGIYFPVLAVCNGFESLLVLSNNQSDMQTRCYSRNHYYPLIFEPNYRESLTFSRVPDDLVIYYKYFDSTNHRHIWCTTPANFSSAGLTKEWTITATSRDYRGLRFVSCYEHKRYPIVAVQFHPETHFNEAYPQDTKKYARVNVKAGQYFYDLLVDLSKLNYNRFKNEKAARKALIYNYAPVYATNDTAVQWYTFR